eukprot:TRINITY_DN9191_c0_g1_i2.p1 TRINITY_DN9191_c0_g1~~TRINITY_DN9191_c0_g1_i2.p1  ORF type:complete len:360 (-),score=74.35 TRINITY_DN9191_c0_g1_i2:126-1205(-)
MRDYFKLLSAIFFGYNGSKYHGLQKSAVLPTVEGILELAIHKAGLLSQNNYGNLKKSSWNRASRTDKGVHAVGNVVSIKLELPKNLVSSETGELDKLQFKQSIDFNTIQKLIQDQLPEDIRVFGIRFVTQTFNPRKFANSRSYEYLCPSSVFIPGFDASKSLDIDYINFLCNMFVGTKRYHNFSKAIPPEAPTAKRHVKSFRCSFLPEKPDFLKFEVEGSSFLYHQIRKMIGSIVKIRQKELNEQYLVECFSDKRVPDVWLAPPNGLILDKVDFSGYNRKEALAQKLVLTQEEMQKVTEFKKGTLYPFIFSKESEVNLSKTWYTKTMEFEAAGWPEKIRNGKVPTEESDGEEETAEMVI